MLFDDYFYPDSPRRRQQLSDLRDEIKAGFDGFKNAWNENADLLNGIFKAQTVAPYNTIQIRKIQKSIKIDNAKSCTDEINAVLIETKAKFVDLVEDLELSKHLPKDWLEQGANVSDIGTGNVKRIGQILSGILDTAAAAFVGWFVLKGVAVATSIISVATGVASSIGTIFRGAFGVLTCGAVGFVITDLIASAITGALERKELNDAIDALTKFNEKVAQPLVTIAAEVAAETLSINTGFYKLDDKHILMKRSDGSYVISGIPGTDTNSMGNMSLQAVHSDDAALVFIAA
jgi:hypothetical protein